MIDMSVMLLFAGASLALTVTPGPDMLLIASRSMSQGRASGFVSLAGIQAGTYVHALAAALGLSQLLVAVPAAYDLIRFAGAGYLGYLAWKTFTSPASPLAADASLAKVTLWRIFRQGFATNLLNPKMALFVLAFFPQFVDPANGSVPGQMLILATVLNLVGLLVNGMVILLASKIGNKLAADARIAKRLNQALGAVFVALACRLVLVADK